MLFNFLKIQNRWKNLGEFPFQFEDKAQPDQDDRLSRIDNDSRKIELKSSIGSLRVNFIKEESRMTRTQGGQMRNWQQLIHIYRGRR